MSESFRFVNFIPVVFFSVFEEAFSWKYRIGFPKKKLFPQVLNRNQFRRLINFLVENFLLPRILSKTPFLGSLLHLL